MADFWIRVHANLAQKPVTFRAAEALGVKRSAAIGHLVMFWGAVSQHCEDGHVAQYPDAQLESWAGWEGARGRFAKFIREQHLDESGVVREWDEYGGQLRKSRERNRAKVARWRQQQESRNPGVTVTETVTGTVTLPSRNGVMKRNETKRNETEDQLQGVRKRTPPPEWVGLARAQWEAKQGPLTDKRTQSALSPLVTKHGGWEPVSKGMADYLTATPGSKARIEWFAERGTYWVNLAAMPLFDERGNGTERYRVTVEGKAA